MELEDLKRTWAEYDRKLDANIRMNARVLQSVVLGKAETSMNRLSRLLLIELLLSLGAAVLLGTFLSVGDAEARFLIPALMLGLGVVTLLTVCIHQIVAISRIDYGAPIVLIQRRLESLRIERIRTTKWTLLLAPIAWVPLLIVTLRALTGLDVYAAFGAAWIGANVFFGLLVIAVGVWVGRRFGARMERSSVLQRLLRDIAGQNLNDATESLRSISQFEREESGCSSTR